MTTQTLRESFEKEHPKPDGESYCPLDNKYRVDGLITSRYQKTNYQCLWEGYQSGHAARQAEVDELNLAAKYCELIDATPENQRETMLYDALTERDELRAAMQTFVDRVERGEVRSRKTYAQFKALLESGAKVKVESQRRNITSFTVAELIETATKNDQLKYILDAVDDHIRIEGGVTFRVDPESWDELTILVKNHKQRIDQAK